ncbi:MAG: protein phosphatase 2C domain-containing protein [Gammaproteobacteria bacterium]
MPFVCREASLQGARGQNEDALRHFSLGQDRVAVLCDGLGGYPDGGWAARTFADAVEQAVTRFIPADDTPPEQALHDWLQRAWQQFCSEQQNQQRDPQAQTTLRLRRLPIPSLPTSLHAGDSALQCVD